MLTCEVEKMPKAVKLFRSVEAVRVFRVAADSDRMQE